GDDPDPALGVAPAGDVPEPGLGAFAAGCGLAPAFGLELAGGGFAVLLAAAPVCVADPATAPAAAPVVAPAGTAPRGFGAGGGFGALVPDGFGAPAFVAASWPTGGVKTTGVLLACDAAASFTGAAGVCAEVAGACVAGVFFEGVGAFVFGAV